MEWREKILNKLKQERVAKPFSYCKTRSELLITFFIKLMFLFLDLPY